MLIRAEGVEPSAALNVFKGISVGRAIVAPAAERKRLRVIFKLAGDLFMDAVEECLNSIIDNRLKIAEDGKGVKQMIF